MDKKVVVYGVGGHGREIASYISEGRAPGLSLTGFIDDNVTNTGCQVNGFPVFRLEDPKLDPAAISVICGVGDPKIREKLVAKCASRGFSFATLAACLALSRDVGLGEGVMIGPGSILTTNIELRRHVHINVACSISHDVFIDEFANVNPGVHINGWVRVGRRAYVGAGAVISNGHPGRPLIIGDDAVIGAGACVLRSVEAGATVVGVPARPIRSANMLA